MNLPTSRLALGAVTALSFAASLACGGMTLPSGPTSAPATPKATGPLVIHAFRPELGASYDITSKHGFEFSVDSPSGDHKTVTVEEEAAAVVTVAAVTDGRIAEVRVEVTSDTHHSVENGSKTASISPAVGKRFSVTWDAADKAVVATSEGQPASDEESKDVKPLASDFHRDVALPPLKDQPLTVGVAVDARDLGLAGKDDVGTATLQAATPACAAPVTFAVTSTKDDDPDFPGATLAMSMTGTACMDPATGTATRTDASGSMSITGNGGKVSGRITVAGTVLPHGSGTSNPGK